MPNCLPTVNLFEGTVFASRIGIASYSIFNVKHCKERKKTGKVIVYKF
jgi:hypothetical protein